MHCRNLLMLFECTTKVFKNETIVFRMFQSESFDAVKNVKLF